jgi:hypothetical protein
MLGIVKVHDTQKNKFGFLIAVESGERLFFSRHDIDAEPCQLLPGVPVTFELKTYRDNRTHEPRRKAIKVAPADPQSILDAVKTKNDGVPSATFALPPRARAFEPSKGVIEAAGDRDWAKQ